MTEAERYDHQAVLCEAEAARHDPATREGHRLVWRAADCRTMAEWRRRGYGIAWGCVRLLALRPVPGSSGRISVRALRRVGGGFPPTEWVLDHDWLRDQIRRGLSTAVTL